VTLCDSCDSLCDCVCPRSVSAERGGKDSGRRRGVGVRAVNRRGSRLAARPSGLCATPPRRSANTAAAVPTAQFITPIHRLFLLSPLLSFPSLLLWPGRRCRGRACVVARHSPRTQLVDAYVVQEIQVMMMMMMATTVAVHDRRARRCV